QPVGHLARIFIPLTDRGPHLLALAKELVGREAGPPERVGEKVEPEAPVLLQNGQGERARVTATLPLQASAHELDCAVEVGAGAPWGPPREEARGEVGEARAVDPV